jgi:hypothetical protein
LNSWLQRRTAHGRTVGLSHAAVWLQRIDALRCRHVFATVELHGEFTRGQTVSPVGPNSDSVPA